MYFQARNLLPETIANPPDPITVRSLPVAEQPIQLLPCAEPNAPIILAPKKPVRKARTPSPTHWGRLITELRADQAISQRQLAERAGVNRSTLRRIEDGDTSGDIETLERLLNYLGYELDAVSVESVTERTRRQAALAVTVEERARFAARTLLNL